MKKLLTCIILLGSSAFAHAAPPSVPTDVIGSSPDSGEVALSWTAPAGLITDYQIEYKLTTTDIWSLFVDGLSTITTTTLSGLSDGVAYDLRVAAINVDGTGDFSDSIIVTPVDPVPAAPVVSGLGYDTALAVVGIPITAQYDYLDVNANTDMSTIVWSRSLDVVGPYTVIPGATDMVYTPTDMDIGNYIRFDLTPTTNVVPLTGSMETSSATVLVAELNYVNHILSTGQSVSIGTKAIPPISTTQPYANLMLDGHPSSGWGAGTNLIPLVESSWETPGSGMANTITSLRSDTDVAIGLHGYNAVRYTQIKKGTGLYNKGQTQMVNTKSAAESLNRPYRVLGVTVIHGETDDFINTPGATYKSYLEEFQSDYEFDVQVVTGQTETIPLFTDQESSFTSSYYVNKETSEIPLAQLQAAVDNPGKIVMVGPKYFYDYNPTDGAHLAQEGSRLLGEYYGKVIYHVVFEGKEWTPLMPEMVGLRDNILYIDYHVPAGEIEIDTTIVAERPDYGFEFYDNEGSTSISAIEVMDEDTIKITLSQEPLGSDMKLRYAYRGVQGTYANRLDPNAIGGNIRDTDTTLGHSGNQLHNWAVQGEWDVELLPAEEIVSTKKSGSYRRNASYLLDKFKKNTEELVDELVDDSAENNINKPELVCLFNNNIRIGDRDGIFSAWAGTITSSVTKFQSYLSEQGFEPGPIDGIYGSLTAGAMSKLQEKLEVDADGIYGPITKKALMVDC